MICDHQTGKGEYLYEAIAKPPEYISCQVHKVSLLELLCGFSGFCEG